MAYLNRIILKSSILLFSCSLLFSTISFCQTNFSYIFKSILIDEHDQGIGGAYIRNFRTNSFTITDSAGKFSIECLSDDSLLISAMGYEMEKYLISNTHDSYIAMKPMIITLKQVNVYDFKGWDAFKKEFIEKDIPGPKINEKGLPHGKTSPKPIALRSDLFPSTPNVINYIVSPFSSLSYYTNKTEKEKRKVWRLMIQENNEMAYWNVMNTDSIKLWTEIPDCLLDPFVIYCNQHITDKNLNKEYYYKEQIIDLFSRILRNWYSK